MASRRWAVFAVVVLLLTYAAYLLGQWQFHRLHDREATNAQVRTNLRADPAPVAQLLRPGRGPRVADEWRRVRATGTYQPDASVVIRYQTRDGNSGADIVTPLRTVEGPLLVVDRGWVATGNVGSDRVDAPAPPAGRVTVTGWVRVDATGDAATVTDGSARAISSREIARTVAGPVYGGFVDAESETPRPATALVHAELPDLGNGPHFFYGLQWWFFGALAVFGFFYLAYDERRRLRDGTAGPAAGRGPRPRPARAGTPPHGRTPPAARSVATGSGPPPAPARTPGRRSARRATGPGRCRPGRAAAR
jgi:cytochrome oxidase assembly protein ShyY1